MEGESGDIWFFYYMVMKLRWKPWEVTALSPKQKALMYCFIQDTVKAEKKQMDKMKK